MYFKYGFLYSILTMPKFTVLGTTVYSRECVMSFQEFDSNLTSGIVVLICISSSIKTIKFLLLLLDLKFYFLQ
jgi:hypothetical protein